MGSLPTFPELKIVFVRRNHRVCSSHRFSLSTQIKEHPSPKGVQKANDIVIYKSAMIILTNVNLSDRFCLKGGLPNKKALAGSKLSDQFQQLRIRIENRQMGVIGLGKDHAFTGHNIERPFFHLIGDMLR